MAHPDHLIRAHRQVKKSRRAPGCAWRDSLAEQSTSIGPASHYRISGLFTAQSVVLFVRLVFSIVLALPIVLVLSIFFLFVFALAFVLTSRVLYRHHRAGLGSGSAQVYTPKGSCAYV